MLTQKKEHVLLPPAAEIGNIYMVDNEDVVETLQFKLLDLQDEANNVRATADGESRDFTEEEAEKLDTIFAEMKRIKAQIDYRKRIDDSNAALKASMGRRAQPESTDEEEERPTPAARRTSTRYEGGMAVGATRTSFGFRNFGEFAMAVRQGARGNPDPRLIANAPSTYSSEGIGADGGFAVPPDFRSTIMEKVMAEESMLSRTDLMQTASNAITLPSDETTPWQTSGGLQVYWEGEGDQISQSKVALNSVTTRLNKLTALVPVTEELLEDAPTLDSYLQRKVPEKMDFAINFAIVQGTGVGKPLGILNAPCLVSVAKETSQPADTIKAENIIKMWSRLYAGCRPNAVWLINQDIEDQLPRMFIPATNVAGTENVGGMPVYIPPGGLSASPYGTLYGRPIIPTEACNTLGDQGDIILADMSKYLAAIKTTGIRQDVSIHLWFDYDTTAYRFIFRVGGQPWWKAPVTSRTSTTRSCFVTLDERAS